MLQMSVCSNFAFVQGYKVLINTPPKLFMEALLSINGEASLFIWRDQCLLMEAQLTPTFFVALGM